MALGALACGGEPPPPRSAWLRPAGDSPSVSGASGSGVHGAGGWLLFAAGAPDLKIDGVPVQAPPAGLPLPDDRGLVLSVNGRAFPVPARPRDACAATRFAVVGDGRAAAGPAGTGAYRNAIVAEAAAHGPAFVLDTGDLVKHGEVGAEWDRYTAALPAWPPILAVRGNHDRGEGYWTSGAGLPPVFAWAVGALYLVVLDVEGPEPEVRARITEALARFDDAGDRWKVLALHRPVWSRGNHGSDERGLNAQLVPLLEAQGVHLVLSGHDHDYERFCPQLGLGADRRCDPEGVQYVVSGGAATFTVPVPGLSRKVDPAIAERDAQLSQVFSNAQHYLIIDATPDRLSLKAHRSRAGNLRPPGVFDEVVREKPRPAACGGARNPQSVQ